MSTPRGECGLFACRGLTGQQAPGQLRNRLCRIWLIELRHCTAEPGKKSLPPSNELFFIRLSGACSKAQPTSEREIDRAAPGQISGIRLFAASREVVGTIREIDSLLRSSWPCRFLCSLFGACQRKQLAEPHPSNRSLKGQRRGDSGQP